MVQKILRSVTLRVDSDQKLEEIMRSTTKSRGDIISDLVDDYIFQQKNKR